MRKRYVLEVWDRTNSYRLARAAAPLGLSRTRRLLGEETLEVALPLDDAAVSEMPTGAVLRIHERGSSDDLSLWRVAAPALRIDSGGARLARLSADALWMDFRHGMLRQIQADGSVLVDFGMVGLAPSDWLANVILPAYDGDAIGFQLGAVEPTDPVDLDFSRTSPLEALRMLEERTGCEAQFRLDATGTFYHVDLLNRIGNASGGAEFRYRKNVKGGELITDETDVVTRLYAWGADGLSLADAVWALGAVAGTAGARVVTIADEALHASGEALLDGLWLSITGKGVYPITAHDPVAQTITLDDTALALPVAGDEGYVAEDATGTRMSFLELPSAVASYGVRVGSIDYPDIPNVRNLVDNADLSAWSGGLPDGWSKIDSAGVVAESVDPAYAKNGGKAAHVTAAAAGQGLISDAFTVPTGDARRPYLGISASLTVKTGRVRLELRHSNGKTYPLDAQQGSEGLDVYLTLAAVPVSTEPLPAGTAQLAIVAHGAAAEFYLDTALASPVTGSELGGFIPGDGAKYLWEDTAAELARIGRPRREYRLDVVDLYRADQDAFAFDRIDLGDDVTVRHPDLGNVTQRVVDLNEDLLSAAVTRVVLAASAQERLASVLRPSLRRMGKQGGLGRPTQLKAVLLHVAHTFDPLTGELTVNALGSESTATLELRTKTVDADPWPVAATETVSDREAAFAPILLTAGEPLFYQVTALDARGIVGDTFESGDYRDALGPEFQVVNVRVLRVDDTTSRVLFEPGAHIDEVWIWYTLEDAESTVDPWPSGADLPNEILEVGVAANEWSFSHPDKGYLGFLQLEPRYDRGDGTLVAGGPIWRAVIGPSGMLVPTVDKDWSEDGAAGTAWLALTNVGILVTAVHFRSTVGASTPSDWVAATRGIGAASVVKGGLLAADQYEFDVTLDSERISTVEARLTLVTGEYQFVSFPAFDRNRAPNFISASFNPDTLLLTVSWDADTKSQKVLRTDGGGVQEDEADGPFVIFDLGALGMTTADRWVVDLIGRSDTIGELDIDTIESEQPFICTGSAWGAGADPQFLAGGAGLSVDIPAIGSSNVTIHVQADGAGASHTLHFWEQHRYDAGPWSSAVEITALVVPDATGVAPPTVSTPYTFTTIAGRVAKADAAATFTQRIIAEIEDSGDVVRASRSIDRSWSTAEPI